jgi:hypothetical protein
MGDESDLLSLFLAKMPLTLFIPDLLPPADAPESMRSLRLPALERWLARAEARREPGTGTAWLLRQWGLERDAPVAALTLAAEGHAREGSWLRADPVHQRVERNALVLHDASVLGLAREEVDEALEALNAFFAADGLAFVAPAIDRWYVRIPAGDAPVTVPLEEAIGRNPFGMLPSSGTRLRWRSLFSEAQMLLAALPFNARREAEGHPALNGVWFWGGGEMPASLPRPYAEVAASEVLARGLSLASHCGLNPLPGSLADLPAVNTGECLAVISSMTGPLRRGDAEQWQVAAAALDREWFDALGAALARFHSVRVVLPAERDTAVFDLHAGARWRLFRRPKPLASHA